MLFYLAEIVATRWKTPCRVGVFHTFKLNDRKYCKKIIIGFVEYILFLIRVYLILISD